MAVAFKSLLSATLADPSILPLPYRFVHCYNASMHACLVLAEPAKPMLNNLKKKRHAWQRQEDTFPNVKIAIAWGDVCGDRQT